MDNREIASSISNNIDSISTLINEVLTQSYKTPIQEGWNYRIIMFKDDKLLKCLLSNKKTSIPELEDQAFFVCSIPADLGSNCEEVNDIIINESQELYTDKVYELIDELISDY